jgi:glycosyltransferase involved in cell wall biosynthesis
MTRVTLIIPCFNEARRLDPVALGTLLDDERVELLFVDDGSTDTTRAIVARRRLCGAGSPRRSRDRRPR